MKYVYTLRQIAEQKKLDVAERDKLWAALAEEAGGGEEGLAVANALRKLYTMYDSRLVDWSATLYDKGHGAYYTSSVGRDTEGFLPDVESTVQMLRFLDSSGLMRGVGGDWRKGLPKWMIHQMVYYAKSIQDENGFFYNPNWAKETADEMISRRARDVGWCTNLMKELGELPVYDAPNGTPGGGSTPDEYWASLNTELPPPPYAKALYEKKLAERANMSQSAKEAEAARAKASVAYLSSHPAFVDYLDERLIPGMKDNPYFYGNEVGETWQQVKNANSKLGKYEFKESDGERYRVFDGMTLPDILIHELDEAINPSTGLWGDVRPSKPTGKEFLFTNGFMKGMAAYNGLKYPYPAKYLLTVANTLMDSLLGDEPSVYNICEVFNSWHSVFRLRENLQYVKDEETKAKVNKALQDVLIKKAPEAILNSYEKIKGYKKLDGGFAHSYYTGTPNHQGLPISTRENVGDVDATCIGSTGLVRVMFGALGLTTPVPILMHSDYMRYINILENLAPVQKFKTLNPLIDFENGVNHTAFTAGGAKFALVPFEESYAMKASLAAKGQAVRVTYTAHSWDGDHYLFEGKLCLGSDCEGKSFILKYENAKQCSPIHLYLNAENGYVKIGCEEYGMAEYKQIAELGKSFTLRLEYRNTEESGELKIFVNGKQAGELINSGSTDEKHPSGYPARAMTAFDLTSLSDGECTVYLDDVMFYYAREN